MVLSIPKTGYTIYLSLPRCLAANVNHKFRQNQDNPNDNDTTKRRVVNLDFQLYRWNGTITTNAPNGIANFNTILASNLGAMWIFQDLRRAWETIYNNTSPQIDPGPVTAKWADGVNCHPIPVYPWEICSSFFYAGPILGGPFIFIRQPDLISADMVVHETGHQYMHRATGNWTFFDESCHEHYMFQPEDLNCAWTEGWGDFLALAVNIRYIDPAHDDTCFDWKIGPCGAGQQSYEDI